jgi:anaerobic magnesium-protoporphyrin IX monomethyl ester cyclase
MHIVFVHTPMATVPVAERENFWRNFDIRYHAAHPGLRHMKNVLWELPHWMHWLGGVLVDAGYTSLEAIDLYTSECTLDGINRTRLEEALRRSPGDLYLLSPMTPNLHFALEIATLVKEIYPRAKTVLGGVIATPLHRDIASHPHVDYVIHGRGENALPALVRAIEQGSGIEKVGHLSFKGADGAVVTTKVSYPWMPVNHIPKPKIDLFDSSVGEDIRYLRQVYGLGCPYKCSFCTIQTIGQKADYFHTDRTIAEIHAYRDHYGKHHNVYFGDETFTANKPRTLEMCTALRLDGTIKYDIQTRLNCLTDSEVLKGLKESGCCWVEIGVETFSQETQDQHKQRMKLSELEDTLARIRDSGLAVCSFLVNGFPNQTIDDMKRSLDYACSLLSRDLLQASYLFGLVPYPGSDLYENPSRYGMKILHKDFRLYHEEMQPVYETEFASSEEIHKAFLLGVKQIGQAMSGRSGLLPMPVDAQGGAYGSFWHGSHV